MTIVTSIVSAALIVLLIVAGWAGPHDPAENLLPLGVWTLWWVIIVLLHPLFGNLWAALNPFTGLHALLRVRAPPLAYPQGLSYWPALFIFLAFAWFQLVYRSPEDPDTLAMVVSVYLVATLVAVLLFGPAQWLGRADPFAVFFSQLGAAAPIGAGGARPPGLGLLTLSPLPLSGMLFVLLTLSSISFDGFANTFLWLSSAGVNPLDYPGRTAMMAANSAGLIASFLALAVAYALSVAAGWAWAGRPGTLSPLRGRLVYSLIPISIAYHFAHYLPDTLVNLQYLAKALNDPLEAGADLLGLADWEVTTSFLNTASGALAIFSIQTGAVVIGHIAGVAVAHGIAIESGLDQVDTLKLEAPLGLLMVAYTAFGLWLLAAPAIS